MNNTNLTPTDLHLRLDEALRDGAEAPTIDLCRALIEVDDLTAAHHMLLTIEANLYL